MLADALDNLVEQYPECLIAAYADISTGVALVTRGPVDVPREALDELCAEAALTLGLPDQPAVGAEPCASAIKAVEHATYVYLRAADEPSDALLCMCRPEVDVDGFITAAHACLAPT